MTSIVSCTSVCIEETGYIHGARYALQNARSLQKAAAVLANQLDYGYAASLLILASEEAVKSIDLFVKHSGILGGGGLLSDTTKNLHKERHSTAKILISVVSYLGDTAESELTDEVFREAIIDVIKNFISDTKNKNLNPKLIQMREFWGRANHIKNSGFYVDKGVRKWSTPGQFSRADYETIIDCVCYIINGARLARVLIHYMPRLGLDVLNELDVEDIVNSITPEELGITVDD